MTLVVGRALAGVGAAALFSGSMTILGYSVPIEKRAIYLGCMSSMFGIASVVGPIMGGALTDNLSWQVLYIFSKRICANITKGAGASGSISHLEECPGSPFSSSSITQSFVSPVYR